MCEIVESRFADVDEAIAWRERGHGDAVVFLHGLGGSRLAWESQLESLGERWRCVAWDMPGYGASATIEPLTFPAIADAIARLLDRLGVHRAHLCGLSFGGQQALHTALRHPDRVRSLVLADTSAAFGIDGTDADDWIAARTSALDEGRRPADIANAVLTAIAGPDFGGIELDRAEAAFARISSEGLRAACHALVEHDVRERLGEIDVPTLVIVGELDTETPPSYSRMLADRIPGARLELLPGVGHLSPSEDPDRFNALVADFLAGVPPCPPLPDAPISDPPTSR